MATIKIGRFTVTDPDTIFCLEVWPALRHKVYDSDQYVALAAYGRTEIDDTRSALSTILPGMSEIEKIQTAMKFVREMEKQPVERVVDTLRKHTSLPNHMQRQEDDIISAATSLSIMAKIQIRALTGTESESTTLWQAGSSLNDKVAQIFPMANEPEDSPISQNLTISNLARYNGCSIYWTDRLDRHLEYRDICGSKVLSVFQHKIWLSANVDPTMQGQNTNIQATGCIVPQRIICETLDTLNLLFPQNNKDTERFLKERDQKFYSLGYCGRDRKLNLKDYPHWGPRLKRLIGVFEGPRSGLWRLLPKQDKGDLLESANFWIATAAALLAFTGFVLGLMSIMYAKLSYDVSVKSMAISEESLELTRLQYQLSLAQACSDPNEARLLPEFCSAEE